MENSKPITPLSFSPEDSMKDLEEQRAIKEADKEVRELMTLAIGCEEMTRIVNDILIPEFLSLTHRMTKAGYRAEVVAYDAENPIYEDEMCNIGMKFRCGDRDNPCKIEFVADPNTFHFNITIRNPDGEETAEDWTFQSVIPKNLRSLIIHFIDDYFLDTGYKLKLNDFDQHDDNLEGPFRVIIEEDEGEITEVANTETMEEAIQMGISFSKMFKGKILYIVNRDGDIVC